MAKIIYYFESKPSYGYSGMMGGDSVTVYEDGVIEKAWYVFGKKEPKFRDIIAVDNEAAIKIQGILDAHKDEIRKLPLSYADDIMDGSMDKIQFGNKIIRTMWIHRTDLEKIEEKNSLYYEEAYFSNLILDIKDEIDEIIDVYGSSDVIKFIDFLTGNETGKNKEVEAPMVCDYAMTEVMGNTENQQGLSNDTGRTVKQRKGFLARLREKLRWLG